MKDDLAAMVASIADARFEALRVLGEGASGVVVAAYDRARGQAIALKLVGLGDATHAAGSLVQHRNLVRVDGVHPHARGVAIAMELVAGVDFVTHVRGPSPPPVDPSTMPPTLPLAFGQRLQEGRASAFHPCSIEAIARLRGALLQLGAGVAALHAAGKVHRDLKPSNVLVESEGRVVVLDFGLLRDAGARSTQLEGAFAGTPAYMAPEQSGGEATTASDVYAIGVMLFEALTGALPFEGSAQEVILRKQSVSAPAPSLVVGDAAPADLDRLTIELLRREPTLRPDAVAIMRRLARPP